MPMCVQRLLLILRLPQAHLHQRLLIHSQEQLQGVATGTGTGSTFNKRSDNCCNNCP